VGKRPLTSSTLSSTSSSSKKLTVVNANRPQTSSATVYNKVGGWFKIQVPLSLTISNIVFDAVDSAISCNSILLTYIDTSGDSCLDSTSPCCTYDSSSRSITCTTQSNVCVYTDQSCAYKPFNGLFEMKLHKHSAVTSQKITITVSKIISDERWLTAFRTARSRTSSMRWGRWSRCQLTTHTLL
jgi:hypothetical protein